MEDWAVACVSATPIHCTEHTHISHQVEYGVPVVFPEARPYALSRCLISRAHYSTAAGVATATRLVATRARSPWLNEVSPSTV